MNTSKLPAGVKFLPDLAAHVESSLAPYTGKKLEKAQTAVKLIRQSGFTGVWGELLARYDAAIADAVA